MGNCAVFSNNHLMKFLVPENPPPAATLHKPLSRALWWRALLGLSILALPARAQSGSTLGLEQSTNLQTWQAVPVTPAMLDAQGSILVPPDTDGRFYRLQVVDVILFPSITTQPASFPIFSGQTASLAIVATSTAPLTYQWYEGSAGTTTTPVGTDSAAFTTPVLTTAASYWVRVTNAVGSLDSATAVISVIPQPTFSLIPAGSFTMGRTSGDTDPHAPPVDVTVSSAFYMGKTEVTKAEWDAVRTWGRANGYTDLPAGSGKAADHPVQNIIWYDIVKWCNARSEQHGLTPVYYTNDAQTAVYKTGGLNVTNAQVKWAANGYRLPTEAEWEKAARGGLSGYRFPWGDTISQSQANYHGNTTSYSYDLGPSGYNSIGSIGGTTPATSPAGSFAANDYGLYDMEGNVSEWCWDFYGATTYVDGATDPRGAESGSYRVIRGGSWYDYASFCRVAYRNFGSPFGSATIIGFRVARSFR